MYERPYNTVTRQVVAGHHLPSDGSFDMADPYALLELRPAPVRRTAII